MKYTCYNPETGQITYTITASNQELLDLNLAEQSCIAGEWSGQEYYIANGSAVPIPQRPTHENLIHRFDYHTKQWTVDYPASEQQTRNRRNSMLQAVDKINPVWYASLSPAQQQELIQYRQALLDIPQQPGFPGQVQWPSKPHWL